MAREWRESTVGQEVEILLGFAFKSAAFATEPPGHRLLRGDNIKRGSLEWGEKARFWRTLTPELERYSLETGDIVVGMDGSRVGENFARVAQEDLPALLVQRVACLRARGSMEQAYLRYLICNPKFTAYVKAVHTGTSIPHISGSQIGAYPILVPPMAEQRAIAAVLGALDDKIELNRRMCRTLEGIARAIFQSWFVDFEPVRWKMQRKDATQRRKDAKTQSRKEKPESLAPSRPCVLALNPEILDLFPDRLVDSPLGPIPEGWTVQGLDEIADFLNGLALQRFPPCDDRWLPVIKIAQLRAGHTVGADRASADIDPAYIVGDGDVLFSWSGSLECVLWAGGPGALNQHLFKVTSNRSPKWLYYHWIHHHLDHFRHVAAGKATTMGHIQRQHLSEAKVVVPSAEILRVGDELLAPLIDGIPAKLVQSRTLAALRDALLPKLVSGELRIKDVERIIGRCA